MSRRAVRATGARVARGTKRALFTAVTTTLVGATCAQTARGGYSSANTIDLHPASGVNYTVATGVMGTQQVGFGQESAIPTHNPLALLWATDPTAAYNLEPAGFSSSHVNATNGLQEVGEIVTTSLPKTGKATLWNFTPGNPTNSIILHPASGYVFSEALALSGNQQVGNAQPTTGVNHAVMWTGTAASMVDLNSMPTITFAGSIARGTNGTKQVGDGTTGTITHAMLWNGKLSVSGLPDAGYAQSHGNGISGAQEVGSGTIADGTDHALMWDAVGVHDLHPATYNVSSSLATNGANQVGYGQALVGGSTHALIWSGTAASMLDIHSLIPGTPTDSFANAIDVYGNIAGDAFFNNIRHAVVWYAGDTYTGNSSNWSDASAWISGVAPLAGHDVMLTPTIAGSAVLNYPSTTATSLALGKLIVDNPGGGNVQLNLPAMNISTVSTSDTSEVIGLVGQGTIFQTGNVHNVFGTLELGRAAGSSGTYSISGQAALGVTGSLYVGENGSGSFGHANGSLTVGSQLSVGKFFGSTGNYQQTGGTITVSGAESVGEQGTGTFLALGGTHTIAGSLSIGTFASAGNGTFTVSNTGSVSVGTELDVGGSALFAGGQGVLNVFQGNMTIPGAARIWNTSGTAVNLSGGVLSIGSLLTNSNPARLNWTGGTLEFTNSNPLIGSGADLGTSIALTGSKLLRITGNSQFLRVLPTGALTFGGGKLDLTDKKLITATNPVGTASGGTYTDISGAIQSGRNGGDWSGAGIVTSKTDATAGILTSIGVASAQQAKNLANPTDTAVFAGQTVTGSDTLVMYTYGGDANLDGKIDISDYGRIDFNIPLGVAGWYNGDFNYDGKIDISDYGMIDFNIGIQGPPFATASLASHTVAVPEPAAVAVLAVLATFESFQRRRRRRR